MIKNDNIINNLKLSEKLDLLIVKNSKNPFGEYKISEIKLIEKIKKVSNIVVYKSNEKSVTYNVISSFKKEVFSQIDDLINDEECNIKLYKTENAVEALNALENNSLFVLSKNPKNLCSELMNKVEKFKESKESLDLELITEYEFNELIKDNEIYSEEKLDTLLDVKISQLLPFIEKVENTNLEKKEYGITNNLFSAKVKKMFLMIIAAYYNILMYFVFGHANNEVDINNKYYIIGFWAFINLIFILVFFRLRNKKIKKVKNDVIKEVQTIDFEVVEPTIHEVVVTKSNFNQINLKELCESFYIYLLNKGLMLEPKKIRELFAAMSASRLVIINNKSLKNKEFLEVLNEFFGNKTYYKELSNDVATEHDVFFEDGTLVSDFTKGICNSIDNTSTVNITSLLNVNLDNCNLYLNSIVNYAKNPNEKGRITLDSSDYSISNYIVGKNLPIPTNTWFILFSKENNNIIKNAVVKEAITIDIDVTQVERKETTEEFKVLSAVNFLDAINKARESNFLSNDSWDKIDELENGLNRKINFNIENKIIRKLEIFASVYNVISEDERTSLDASIANILLPIIFYNKTGIYNDVLDCLKEVFEEEYILSTKESLIKFK